MGKGRRGVASVIVGSCQHFKVQFHLSLFISACQLHKSSFYSKLVNYSAHNLGALGDVKKKYNVAVDSVSYTVAFKLSLQLIFIYM